MTEKGEKRREEKREEWMVQDTRYGRKSRGVYACIGFEGVCCCYLLLESEKATD